MFSAARWGRNQSLPRLSESEADSAEDASEASLDDSEDSSAPKQKRKKQKGQQGQVLFLFASKFQTQAKRFVLFI